jgi:hypothetical protein
MSDALIEIRLGSEAIEFIKSKLAQGKTLSKFLLNRPDLNRGEVISLLPSNVDLKKIRNFSEGGVLPTPSSEDHYRYSTPDGTKTVMVPVPNTTPALVAAIEESLRQDVGRLCLFESEVARPSDGFLSSPNAQDLRVLAFDEDVYYLLANDDIDPDKIKKTIRYSTSYLTIGVLAELSKRDKFLPTEQQMTRGKISHDELKLIAERTQTIIVGAYDGESYLLWRQKP